MRIEHNSINLKLNESESIVLHTAIKDYIDTYIHSTLYSHADTKLFMRIKSELRRLNIPNFNEVSTEMKLKIVSDIERGNAT